MGIDDDAKLKAFENSSICTFTYFPQEKRIVLSKRTGKRYGTLSEYSNMPESFAEACVQKNDWPVFKAMYKAIDEGQDCAQAEFHSVDFRATLRVTLTVIKRNENLQPLEALGIIEDGMDLFRAETLDRQIHHHFETLDKHSSEEEKEALTLIASTIGGLYYALYHIWLKNGTYLCYHEKLPGVLAQIGERGNYIPAWETYIAEYIEPEDQKSVTEFAEFSTLAARLKDSNSISLTYRRKGVGWTRGQFFCAKRDEDGNAVNVIYAVTDINAEMVREKRSRKAIYEAHHDSLTNVLNRAGFESVVETQSLIGDYGFALIDIDHFKNLNDTYGHDAGDRVLRRVAECLTDTFRNEDSVFRYGGDEFGILLKDCRPDAWSIICRKFENIHKKLGKAFPNMGTITLSVGLIFADHGYDNELLLLADEGLYETKQNGRAGCTLMNTDHTVAKRWRDEKLSLHTEAALDRSATGVFRIDFPKVTSKAPRMLCNETTKRILGMEENLTPEECYRIWVQGIEPSYLDAVLETKHKMVSGRQAEVTYLWHHPQFGFINIRSGGYGEENEDAETLHGYVHGLKDTNIITRKDDSEKIVTVMNDIFIASYYLNLKDGSYRAIKEPQSSKEIRNDRNRIVIDNNYVEMLAMPQDVELMRKFCDLSTLPKRLEGKQHIDRVYRRKTDGVWCQASYIPVDYGVDGMLSHVLFTITLLDENRVRDIEEGLDSKRSLQALFDHVPGGIILYEWNGKQLKTLKISRFYAEQYGDTMVSERGNNAGGPDFSRVHPEDVKAYQAAILHALNVTHHLEYVYRAWNNLQEKYVWVKLDAVSEPQSDGTSLVYAMYSDVTKQIGEK